MSKSCLLPLSILFTLSFTSCSESDLPTVTVASGKVVFSLQDDPRESVQLVSARTTVDASQTVVYVSIIQEGDTIIAREKYDALEYVELAPGQYRVNMIIADNRELYRGKVAAEGSADFQVEPGMEKQLP